MATPDPEKIKRALKNAGVSIPAEHESSATRAKIEAELSKEGIHLEPDWYVAVGSSYALVGKVRQ